MIRVALLGTIEEKQRKWDQDNDGKFHLTTVGVLTMLTLSGLNEPTFTQKMSFSS